MEDMGNVSKWVIQTTRAILYMVKLKDIHTFHHCCRVGEQARQLAKSMGLDKHQQNITEFSGLLHDIGKIGIAESILMKPGSLSDEEMNTIKQHPEMSVEIIQQVSSHSFFRLLLPGVKFHHEKFDGSGYPCQLAGEKIPLSSRIIAIVDAVDAMTHTRAYRNALSMDKAKKELVNFSGSQFDKHIVRIYLEAHKYWKAQEPTDAEESSQDLLQAA